MIRKIIALGLVISASIGLFALVFWPPRQEPKVAVIRVEGTIDNFATAHRAARVAKDGSVEAAVINVNSPGGYVSPSFQLETAISALENSKPTVAVVEQLGASGAYLAASAADDLYVHHSSQVGALGVIAVWVSLENHYKQEGIKHYVFQTGKHKDMFAPWRGPTENEKEIIRSEIYRIKARMIDTIVNNRPSLENNLPPEVVSGEIVRGFEAVELGLSDNIVLTDEKAIERAASLAGLEKGEYEVVEAESL